MSHRPSAALVAASALLLALVASSPATATSPRVILGHQDQSTFISSGSAQDVTGLPAIPAGTWLVTATATLQATPYGNATGDSTTCRLIGGSDDDQGSWALTGDTEGRSMAALLLTIVHHSASAWLARLSCVTTAPDSSIAISNIRISASRGTTSGSGGPRLASAARAASVAGTGDGAFHTVLGLALPAGGWWVAAKADITNTYTSDVIKPICRLKLGTDLDQTQIGLYYPPQQGAEDTLGVQFGHTFATAGTVKLECQSPHSFSTSHVMITALKAGKLVRRTLGGASHTSGNGTPTIITGAADPSVSVAGGSTLQTIATLALPAGTWLVSAKAVLVDGGGALVRCRLILSGADFDERDSRGGQHQVTGISLQSAHKFGSAGNARLACSVPGGTTGDVKASFRRITAVSAGSLTQAELPL